MGISTEIAEIMGIIIGDGNIVYSKEKNKVKYRLIITGHKTDDYNYLINYVSPLISKVFKKRPNLWYHKNKNAIAIALYSKEVISYLVNDLGLTAGPKKNLHIPQVILSSNKKIKASFLRGLFDTDGGVTFKKKQRKTHSYPVIEGNTNSPILAKQIIKILREFDIKCNICKRERILNNNPKIIYQLDIYGHHYFKKWLKEIGFKNKKHNSKIDIWNKQGYYTPKTIDLNNEF